MNTQIQNSAGETIDYTFEKGDSLTNSGKLLVILGHGVTGNKDRPVIVDIAHALNQAGIDTVRFSFSGNGSSSGRFEDATITKEVNDLETIIDAFTASYTNIIYIGHSMGAAVGVIRAAQDSRIRALISVAGMVNTKKFATTEFGKETPDHGLMWEEESCPLSSDFMQDLCETIQTIEPQISDIDVPWLLIHGTADDVVLPEDTEKVATIQNQAATVVFIEGADHSFNDPIHKNQLIETIRIWLKDAFSNRKQI